MKTLLVGIGAAGNKAAVQAVANGIVNEEDVIIINSTSKDFPKEFNGKTIVLSPHDTGCGKERSVAKEYALSAVKAGKFNIEEIKNYVTVIICTSVEGGTGSGSTPIIAKFFNQVFRKNVHVVAFTGFEEDVRGLGNTLEFFQEIDSNLIVETVSNAAFLRLAGQNKFKAEKMANDEMCRRIAVLTGQDFIDSEQNIDDTDILKVSNTSGYMTVEKIMLDKPLVDQDDFNRVVKNMVYNSKSVKSENPGAVRLGVILNIDPASEDAIDFNFTYLKEAYGNPYECFLQKQWDGKKEYIAFIASGMQMPLDAIKALYDRYQEQSQKVNKTADEFYNAMKSMTVNEEDHKFDMIRTANSGTSMEDFMKQFETK